MVIFHSYLYVYQAGYQASYDFTGPSHGSEAGPAEAYRGAFHRRQLGTGRRRRSSKIPRAAAWGQLVFLSGAARELRQGTRDQAMAIGKKTAI